MTTSSAGRASPDSITDRVAAEILRRLMAGEFVPGQRLIEAELATEFGVSRGPVREAVSRLAAEGHLVLERNRGAVVRRLSTEDVRELYQIREILEGAAAGLAAANIAGGADPARLTAMLEINHGYLRATDLAGYVEHNEAFHALVVELASNALLAGIVASLRTRAFRMQHRHLITVEGVQVSAEQHDMIGAAILAGDAASAEQAMRAHVRRSSEEIAHGQGRAPVPFPGT